GTWRATMFCGTGRREIRWTGEYHEVAAPERLVFTISDRPGEPRYELVTVVLTDVGDGRTEMHFEQRGHMRPDEYDRAKQGWGTFFARIDERLAGHARPATPARLPPAAASRGRAARGSIRGRRGAAACGSGGARVQSH